MGTIKKIKYERGANLGNFETCKIEVESELAAGETPKEAFLAAKKFVDAALQHEIKENDKILRNDRGARKV